MKRGRQLIGQNEMDQILVILHSDSFVGEFCHTLHRQKFDSSNRQSQDTLDKGMLGRLIICCPEDASRQTPLKRSLSSLSLPNGESFDNTFQHTCKKSKFSSK